MGNGVAASPRAEREDAAALFALGARDLAGFRIDQMGPRAGRTCDGLVGVTLGKRVGGDTLHAVAGRRTPEDEASHPVFINMGEPAANYGNLRRMSGLLHFPASRPRGAARFGQGSLEFE